MSIAKTRSPLGIGSQRAAFLGEFTACPRKPLRIIDDRWDTTPGFGQQPGWFSV